MAEHKIIITDSGGGRLGEIVNHTGFEWGKEKNSFGFFKVDIPLDVYEAKTDFVLPIERYLKYYRDGVLKWEGIILTKKYTVRDQQAVLEVGAVGLLFLLKKRYLDDYWDLQPAKDIVLDILDRVNTEWNTKIQPGIIDVTVEHDIDAFNTSVFDVLTYFGDMGYQFQIRSEDGEWFLDFRESLGEEKIDIYGNPTVTFSNLNGTVQGWEHEFDGSMYRNAETALGNGTGSTQVRWSDFDADARSKYGLFKEIENYPGIQSEFVLSTFIARDLEKYSQPVERFEIDLARGRFDFDAVDIHDTVFVHLKRENYESKKFVQIDGLEVSVNKNNIEDVKLGINVIL